MDDEGWEARMAERARQRRVDRDARDVALAAEEITRRAALLDAAGRDRYYGWPVHADTATVRVGSATHCALCGRFFGIGCVSVDVDAPDRPAPEWPYTEDDCPVCPARGGV